MAEKFDKYYEYFSKSSRSRGIRAGRLINLGIVKINLGDSSIGIGFRRSGKTLASGIIEGENVNIKDPPNDVKAVKGKYVYVEGGDLDVVEGKEITLVNVRIRKVIGKRITMTNSYAESIEAEESKLMNTNASLAVVNRGTFINCNIDTLEYKESYKVINTMVKNIRQVDDYG
ncbi:MAG: hypothetical protein RXN93_09350 [Thermocladium sp.]|jgi:hypothetical protein